MSSRLSVAQQLGTLYEKIDAVRRRTQWLAVLRGLRKGSWLWLASLILFGGAILLVPLPGIVRIVLLALHAALTVWGIWTGGGRPALRRRSLSDWALRCEESDPAMQKRLVTCVDLAAHDGGKEVLQTSPVANVLLSETVERFDRFDPRRAIPGSSHYHVALSALAPWLLLFLMLLSGDTARQMIVSLYDFRSPVESVFGSFETLSRDPIADLKVEPGDVEAPRGSSVDVQAAVVMKKAGAALEQPPVVVLRQKDDEAQECRMDKDSPTSESYTLRVADVTKPLTYQVTLPTRKSAVYKIDPYDPPEIADISTTAALPAYLHRPPETILGARVSAPASSTLAMRVESTQPLDSARLTSEGATVYTAEVNGQTALFEFALDASKSLRLEVTDTAGHANLDPPLIQIRAEKDSPPKIKVKRPGADFWPNRVGEVTLEFEARDDFGLKDVSLEYQINDGDTTSVQLFKARDGQPVERRGGEFLLDLEKMKANVGDTILYTFRAHDERPDGRSGEGTSQPYFVIVRSFDQPFTGGGRARGGGGGGLPSQRDIIVATMRLIDAKPTLSADDVTSKCRDVARVQREVRGLAESFLSMLKSEANIPDVERRVGHMEEAIHEMTFADALLELIRPEEALKPENAAQQHLVAALAGLPLRVLRGSGMMSMIVPVPPLDLNSPDEVAEPEPDSHETNPDADAEQRELQEALNRVFEMARRQKEFAERMGEELRGARSERSNQPDASSPSGQRTRDDQTSDERVSEELRKAAEENRKRLERLRDDIQNLDHLQDELKERVDRALDDAGDEMSRMDDALRRRDWEQAQIANARVMENLRDAEAILRQAASAPRDDDSPLRRYEKALQAVREFQETLGGDRANRSDRSDQANQAGQAGQAGEGQQGQSGEAQAQDEGRGEEQGQGEEGQGQGEGQRQSQADGEQPGEGQGGGRGHGLGDGDSGGTPSNASWSPGGGRIETGRVPRDDAGDPIIRLQNVERYVPLDGVFAPNLQQVRKLALDLGDGRHPPGQTPVLIGQLMAALENLAEQLEIEIGRLDQMQRLRQTPEDELPPEFRRLSERYFELLGASESAPSRP